MERQKKGVSHSLSLQNKKKVYFQVQIAGLAGGHFMNENESIYERKQIDNYRNREIALINFWRDCWKGILTAVFGILMIGYGVYRGETAAVLEKAINICLECIGIG